MDLTSVDEVLLSADPDAWRPGDSWLAGGTVLQSYGTDPVHGRPRRLLDITTAGWPDLTWHTADAEQRRVCGLEIAATCTVATLYALPSSKLPVPRSALPGLDLVRGCCDSFVAGWKIWTMSTVGGNVATALPAGPMTSLLAGLDATALVLGPGGTSRVVPVADLVTGDSRTDLGDGELIRSLHVSGDALAQPVAFRRISLRERGRSAALVIARRTGEHQVRVVVTAATTLPVVLDLDTGTAPHRQRLLAAGVAGRWHDDVHGDPSWREAMTYRLVEEAVAELMPGWAPDAVGRRSGDLHLDREHA